MSYLCTQFQSSSFSCSKDMKEDLLWFWRHLLNTVKTLIQLGWVLGRWAGLAFRLGLIMHTASPTLCRHHTL